MTNPTFKDYFSANSAAYATFRPKYPPALFDFVASLPDQRRAVWDCATGNGQAAVPLAERFDRVIATDASADQVAQATPHPRVDYRVALADASGLDRSSIDIVTVAQALHWFPLERFFAEARRVLVPRGILAVWCYTKPEMGGVVDDIFERFYSGRCGPYWSPERDLVDTGYRTIAMPFEDIPAPAFAIEDRLSVEEFGGYLRTWSAAKKLAAAVGGDPVSEIEAELKPVWDTDDGRRLVRWPIHVRAGRMNVDG